MMKNIFLILICALCNSSFVYSQLSREYAEQLTAYGIYTALEPADKVVIEKAVAITGDFPGNYNIKQVCAVFDYLYKGWKYQSDPNGLEFFEKGSDAVTTLTGDCDDYAIAMISLVESIGGDGRIVCVSGHAYPELYLGKNLSDNDINNISDEINNYYQNSASKRYRRNMNYHKDHDGSFWLNLDYQENRPGGSFYEYAPDAEHLVIYSNGKYRLAFLNTE